MARGSNALKKQVDAEMAARGFISVNGYANRYGTTYRVARALAMKDPDSVLSKITRTRYMRLPANIISPWPAPAGKDWPGRYRGWLGGGGG